MQTRSAIKIWILDPAERCCCRTGQEAQPTRICLISGSKSGTVYLLDRDRLGHFQPDGDTQIVQSLQAAVGPLFGIPAYFNHTVYFSAAHDQVKAFALQNGLLSTSPVSASGSTFAELGTVPSISANGASNGILWTIDPAGQLHAYDAADLSDQLYQGSVGTYVKFSTPTIANGKVYVGTADSLVVFGLREPGHRQRSSDRECQWIPTRTGGARFHCCFVRFQPRAARRAKLPVRPGPKFWRTPRCSSTERPRRSPT